MAGRLFRVVRVLRREWVKEEGELEGLRVGRGEVSKARDAWRVGGAAAGGREGNGRESAWFWLGVAGASLTYEFEGNAVGGSVKVLAETGEPRNIQKYFRWTC